MTVARGLVCALDVGAWIDDPPRLVLTDRYLERLRGLRLGHVAVMLDGVRPGLVDARWTAADLERLRDALPQSTRRIITTCPIPSRAHMAEMEDALPALLRAFGSNAVEHDLEPFLGRGWDRAQVDGFLGLADAGRELVSRTLDAGAEHVEITTFPGAIPGAVGAIAAAGSLSLQCYPTAREGRTYDGPQGPARFPLAAIEAARKRFPGVELVAGLPAYRQTWPGVAPDAAMAVALASAQAGGASVVRYWSAKWLCRLSARKYAAPFVASLALS